MNILVIEDEEGMREAVIRSLKEEGYGAEGACNGEDGYDLIKTEIYDMIILDIMLPKMNGLQVLSRIRQEGMTIPVILLTARSELDDKITGMDSGADDYLTKPFNMEELLARIRMVTRRSYQVSVSNLLNVNDLTLNVQTYEITSTKSGRTVKLGNKEFQLLEYLMHNAGIVLSREQITEKVWGFDSEAEYNNVDVYISFIRKKMQFVGTNVKIGSVRGVGYQLQEPDTV